MFVLSHEIGGVLLNAKQTDGEAMSLARTAMVVRRDILQVKNSFDGTFAANSQKTSVPPSLTTLLDMILRGPITKKDPTENQACLTIAQLLVFNSISRIRDKSGSSTRHTPHVRNRECPLPIYTALKIHGTTRDKSLIETFYRLGMCISYDRLLSLSTDITNSVIDGYDKDGVICPSKLRGGIFTTAALDNIDYNPSSTSAQDSFHGTAISLVQHPTTEKPGTVRPIDVFDNDHVCKSNKIATLPSYYTDLPPLTLPSNDIIVPETAAQFEPSDHRNLVPEEKEWLEHTRQTLTKTELGKDDTVSWAAYHASQSSLSNNQPAILSLLPMFAENSHSPAMIAHAIKVIAASTKNVNPSQTPVLAVDQPLFALAKEVQWKVIIVINYTIRSLYKSILNVRYLLEVR